MLDVVPPELADLFKHGVLNLMPVERLVGELVVGRTLGLDDRGRRRQGGVGVGVLGRQVGDGLCAAVEKEGESSGEGHEQKIARERLARTSLALSWEA